MSESIWKKEIHLRKPKQPKQETAPAPVAPQAAEPSIWKKEIRLKKRPEPLPPLPAHLLERQRTRPTEPSPEERVERPERPRGTVVVPVVPDRPEPLQRVERWTARVPAPHTDFPRPAAGEEQDPVALLPRERATVDPAPAVPPLPTPATSYGWSKPPAPAAPAEVSDAEVPDARQAPPVPSLSEAFSAFTAAEAARQAETADAAVPEAPDSPVTASAPSPSDAFPAFAETAPAHEPEPDPEPEPVVVVEPAAEKVPLLKREIHLGRTPKAPKAPKEKKQKAPAGPKNDVPLLKRELSLPRPRRRERVESGHKVTRVVGLRIGSSQLAAAHVRNNGSHEVLQLARTELERGLVVAGEIREPVALAKALKSFFAANKLPRKDIRLGVASNRIGVRMLDVPAVGDHKQFENAIRFRAQETLPIPVSDAVLDHVVVGEHANEEGDAVRRVLLVFAHKELVSRYVDVCRQAGLRLAGIDLDAFALLRAVGADDGDGPARARVAVALGHERTIFAVSDGSICDFTRVLEWGGSALDVAIARALNVTPSQAAPIKRTLDLDAAEPPADLSPMQFEAVRAAAKAEIGQLVRELLSSLRFYQSRPDSLDIGEIVLAGGSAQLPGLAAEVQRGIGAPVRVADPFAQVSLSRKLQLPDETGSLAIAVGLGIEA